MSTDRSPVTRIRRFLNKPYSGSVVATAIGLVVLILLTAGYGFQLNWVAAWRVIGFPGALPPFSDLRVITDYSADCASPKHVYPFLECAYHKHFNYPPVWLYLGRIGLNPSHIAWLAVAVELPAIALMVMLLRGHTVKMGLIALPIVLSPSVVLAFERGNIDLVEWSLVCLAASLYCEGNRLRMAASLVALLLGVALKFIAVFCAAVAVRFRQWPLAIAVILALFTAGYLYFIGEVLVSIRQITPVVPYVSYGYIIIFDRIEHLYAPGLGMSVAGLTLSWIPAATIGSFLLLSVLFAVLVWYRGRRLCQIADDRAGTAFFFGGGIYCGTFLLLGTHYAYRLVFLLLCLPQLFAWAEKRGRQDNVSRNVAYLFFVSLIISMWLKFRPEYTLHINQIADWVIFGIISAVFALNGLHSLWPRTARNSSAT